MADVPKYDFANDPTHLAFTSFEAGFAKFQ